MTERRTQTVSRAVLLYDTTIRSWHVDVERIVAALDALKSKGLVPHRIDRKDLSPEQLEGWRERAVLISVRRHVRVGRLFGSRSQGGLPDLGRRVPALFVYEEGEIEPSMVHPHARKGEADTSIEGYLAALCESEP